MKITEKSQGKERKEGREGEGRRKVYRKERREGGKEDEHAEVINATYFERKKLVRVIIF